MLSRESIYKLFPNEADDLCALLSRVVLDGVCEYSAKINRILEESSKRNLRSIRDYADLYFSVQQNFSELGYYYVDCKVLSLTDYEVFEFSRKAFETMKKHKALLLSMYGDDDEERKLKATSIQAIGFMLDYAKGGVLL